MSLSPGDILVPAACAGAVAIAATVAIERWGGRAGGLIATLPTTIVPAALGIQAQSPDVDSFRVALFMVPPGLLVNAAFLYVWGALPARLGDLGLGVLGLRGRLAAMILASMLVWALCAAASVLAFGGLEGLGVPLGPVSLALTVLLAGAGVLSCRRGVPAPRGRRRVGLGTMLARGVMAAAAIGIAVGCAGAGGPLLAGMASVFPAIFLTTMVSLWLSQGEAVPAGAVGPMMLGSTSVCAYALLAAWSLPALGALAGTLLAWLAAALLVTVPCWRWLQSRPAAA